MSPPCPTHPSLHDAKLWGAILQKNYSERSRFQFSPPVSFLPIKHQNVPPLTTSGGMDSTRSWGEARRAGAAGGRSEASEEGMEGSLVEFAHHITSANRTLPSISDIFIIPVNFSWIPPPLTFEMTNNLGNLLAYWHRVIRLKTTAASSWPREMSW